METPDKFPYYNLSPGAGPSNRRKRSSSQRESADSSVTLATNSTVPREHILLRTTRQRRTPKAHSSRPTPKKTFALPAPKRCNACAALKFAGETLHFCCGNGSVSLVQNSYPLALERLLTSQEEDAVHFRKYIRMYNSLFAFTSLGGKFESTTVKGIYVFKLHGQIYHNIPSLLPNGSPPKFLQIYFYDGQHEKEIRTDCFPETRLDIIDILMDITKTNPYAQFFRSLRETEITENTQIKINTDTIVDQRTHNAPTSDEVAVIWSESSGTSESSSPHILVTGKNNETHQIKHYYGCYDPLQYPLLFPGGECGWVRNMAKGNAAAATNGPEQSLNPEGDDMTVDTFLADEANRESHGDATSERHISAREYYCYKLQNRPNNLLLRAGRCLQQYIVDMYVKVENTRLDFYRNNQATIRAELYQGILDTFEAGENCAANVGRRVILPPTFLGGPRDMKKRYLNAMSLVQKFGKPDLFLTITCNPSWPEITEHLARGEQAQNRPDLVSRVFRAKLLALKKKIMRGKIFGEVAALIYVVEFQKRGLPHAHFLIILHASARLKGPADFDNFVSAEIPSEKDPHLRSIVLKHMIHGPCGVINPKCQCMLGPKNKGKCKYGYPKKYCPHTTSSEEGYPLYRRRDTGERVLIRRSHIDNRWVIPYNPYLSALFDCHLNVEVCSTIKAVKYLYKYVYKGHDRVSFAVSESTPLRTVDEISHYQAGRWVSPCEAAWRIFGFDLFEMYPPVMPLPIHLQNMQSIQLRPHERLDTVLSNPRRAKTPLTEFFRKNSETRNPKTLYGDFPEKYWWEKVSKKWVRRKNERGVVGRLSFVAPAEGERFYLRLLLLHVRGPTSFDDLLTVDGTRCKTFHEAAIKRRLLEEDDAVNLCLQEACAVQMPAALRRLFATILAFCQPSEPASLWLQYYTHLSADYKYNSPKNPEKVCAQTIRDVEKYLEAMGKTLATFGLESFATVQTEEDRRTRDIEDALDAPIPQQCIDAIGLLNNGQRKAFNQIMDCVRENKPGTFFIDGPGGTGKTFLYNALYAEIRSMGKIVLPTATSGIAASNIPTGRTAHSRFKIPIDLEQSRACDVPKQGSLAWLIREASVIIWDEASMARRENVESLDSLLRDLCDPQQIFGGKIVVFGGDFRQILPVVPNKGVAEVVEYSLVASPLWPRFTKISLTENIRARSDPVFAKFLLELGNGSLQHEDQANIPLPHDVLTEIETQTATTLCNVGQQTYPEMFSGNFKPEIFNTRAILTPMNEDVDEINTTMIEKFPGKAVSYTSFDTMLDDKCNVYPSEFINRLCPGGMAPHDLVLKPNCPVILLRNLLPAFGLCNGTRLICHKFTPNLIECVIATGHNKGEHVFIPRISLRPPSSGSYPFQFQRKQFPIKLSFAMTINKSQGQTLERVSIYLPRQCFSAGQLYVALSRAKKKEQVKVLSVIEKGSQAANVVRNMVSFEVLRLAGIAD